MHRLGRYEIVRPLGSGGMGTVYEAVLDGPAGLRKPVALKVLHDGAEAIRREARIGGLLRHRHLVDVYEVGEADGRWFAALELCAGGSLAGLVPLPPRAVVDVGLQVCAALGYAHEDLGLVHLDLKPANLLVAQGEIKVADLGLAEAEGFRSGGRRVRGTPGYMAPEQVLGDEVDPRADVYALGVTLVELATGALPSAATIDADTWDVPAASVPAWLAPVVDRCLQPHPADRWPDMASLARALRTLTVEGPGLREVLGGASDATGATAPLDEPDAFVGRRDELGTLADWLRSGGIVVLKGPPGIGKTRLARAAARAWQPGGARSAWVCDLSEVDALEGLVRQVSAALDVRGGSDLERAIDRVGHALAGRGGTLLLLDGCDHLGAAVHVIERWATLAPDARIVATARTTPALVGARVLEVGPLARADARALVAIRALRRGIDVADDPELDALVDRLDAVPLALELAAGRLGVLGVRDVLSLLSLKLLRAAGSGPHSTVSVALDWSWDLLTPTEGAALAQLSVFAGGFTLDAAEAVVDVDLPVIDVVGALSDRSMVLRTADGRFALVGTREYAAARLADPSGPLRRHGEWYARLGRPETVEALLGPRAGEVRRALATELPNLVAACERAVARGDSAVAAGALRAACGVLRTTGPYGAGVALAEQVERLGGLSASEHVSVASELGRFLVLATREEEAEAVLHGALHVARSAGLADARGVMLARLGSICLRRGRRGEAEAHGAAALRVARENGHRRSEAMALSLLANVASHGDDPVRAQALYEAALAHLRALGDRPEEGIVLANLAVVLANLWHQRGAPVDRLHEARRLLETALEVHREVGDRASEGQVLANLGQLHRDRGDLDQARRHLEPALQIHRASGDRRAEGVVLSFLGNVHLQEGDAVRALRLFEAAVGVSREVGSPLREGIDLAAAGDALRALGRSEEALRRVRDAIAVHRAHAHHVHEALAHEQVGQWAERDGALAEARAAYEAAIAGHRRARNPAREAELRARLARLGGA